MLSLKLSDVFNKSYINWSISSGGIHVAPNFTPISVAVKSLGCTSFNAFTFTSNSGCVSNKDSASFNFSLTFPLKYSSAVTYLSFSNGTLNIIPSNSLIISSFGLSANLDIYSKLTSAFSDKDTISASFAVSTLVISLYAFIVLFENISAFLKNFPSLSNTSNEHNK